MKFYTIIIYVHAAVLLSLASPKLVAQENPMDGLGVEIDKRVIAANEAIDSMSRVLIHVEIATSVLREISINRIEAPMVNVSTPKDETGFSGVGLPPDGIKDPNQKALYEKELEKHSKNISMLRELLKLRDKARDSLHKAKLELGKIPEGVQKENFMKIIDNLNISLNETLKFDTPTQ